MELLMDMKKVLSVAKVDLVPMRRTSVFSPLSLRKLSESHDLISSKQSDKAMGGSVEVGLVER